MILKTQSFNTLKLPSIVLCITMFASCSSNNSLVSSFSQRKYTKGYFADRIGTVPSIKSNAAIIDKKKAISINNPNSHVFIPFIATSKRPVVNSIAFKQKTQPLLYKLAGQKLVKLLSVSNKIPKVKAPEKVTDDGYGLPKGKDLRAMSIVIIAIGLILITLAMLALLPDVPPSVVLFTGLVALFFGAFDFIRGSAQVDEDAGDQKSVEDEKNKTSSTISLIGFILEIGGLLLSLALFLFATPATLSLAVLLILFTICRLSFYAGFICCIASLIQSQGRYRGLAIIGVIIGVALLTLILLYPIYL